MNKILGIDAGSVAVSLALLDGDRNILKTMYRFHKGAVARTLKEMITQLNESSFSGIAATNSVPDILKNTICFDTQISIIEAVKHIHPDVGSILSIGGENFGLIKFDEKGEYKSYKSNSSCAAGTGSFLDQQAKRLNVSIKCLSDMASANTEDTPVIATRCAVFAKTDLIHAQQQGYSLQQISDGLCEGLVQNIIDTLFADESDIRTPLIFSGGVSMNQSVLNHFRKLQKIEPVVDKYSRHYGAIGAALLLLAKGKIQNNNITDLDMIISDPKQEKTYGYDPLELKLSEYPEFSSEQTYVYSTKNNHTDVEVDIYNTLKKNQQIFMGIDIGSTSTKAVLINRNHDVLAGFYTRTAGQPIKATQAVFEAIDDIAGNQHINFQFTAVSTTGSGRKFIGNVINADMVIDEITAHARAAYELDNRIDTILEIGGQDAKFTTLKDGMVTFSAMNNVCAAGTGSFIEEQAQKLGCPVGDFSRRAMGIRAPLSSDRCTVFMERDLNYYLTEGYSINEVLASVLHSVRENYLSKVAVQANIGTRICFQGATAKNKALIAAFEQKLNQPVFVSKFCHLTGALGSALILAENEITLSRFRGIDIYKKDIPIEHEVCDLCLNKCKINKVTIAGEIVAFGFLCGRDYSTKQYVNNKKNNYQLVDERKRIFSPQYPSVKNKTAVRIGLPQALYMAEDSIMWQYFFNTLGARVVSSKNIKDPIKNGKKMITAEFCAPISAFIGHIKYLKDKVDHIFFPVYLESKEKQKDKQSKYCYFSQFAPTLASSIKKLKMENRIIMPLIDSKQFSPTIELHKLLRPVLNCSYWSVYSAYYEAVNYQKEIQVQLQKIFQREFDSEKDISVLFVGRPYTILEKNMNKNIPDIFDNLGIKTFFQDMLSYNREEVKEIDKLLQVFHWNYASAILEASLISAKTHGLYPVFITSFKCSPDSFAIEYFKRIMDKYNKPYLILQLDGHDSSVGYETRVEAAVRSFRNHFTSCRFTEAAGRALPVIPKTVTKIKGKTLLLPSWDPLNSKLLEAVLIKHGIDARTVPLTKEAIQIGPRTNTGMCIPVNIIIHAYQDYIQANSLDPNRTVVWMFKSDLACSIKLYPYFIKSIFESFGNGMENAGVYIGDITFSDISAQAATDAYFAYMFGGMLRSIGNKIRPYEKEKGTTDRVIDQSMVIFYDLFLGNRKKEDDIRKVVNLFKNIEIAKTDRPKVAVLGDIYVRDNDIMNQNLIHYIEENGGEAITTPFTDILKMLANPHIQRSIRSGTYISAIVAKAMVTIISSLEKNYYRLFNEILNEPRFDRNFDFQKVLDFFNVLLEHTGESADNLLNIYLLKQYHPEIALYVLANPAFCCAGLVTEAMTSKIEEFTGRPVVALTYDGTNKNQNVKLAPYINYLSSKLIK